AIEPGSNGLYQVTSGNMDITANLGGGSLKGELQLRDQTIPSYQTQLDQLASEITDQVNTIHAAASELAGNTAINFFTPLSSACGAAGSIALSSDVAGDARKIAASQDGAPGDNSAATAIGNLLQAPVFSGGSVTDQYGALVFNIGNDAANAQSNFK